MPNPTKEIFRYEVRTRRLPRRRAINRPAHHIRHGFKPLFPRHGRERSGAMVSHEHGVWPVEALSLESVVGKPSLVVDPLRVDLLVLPGQHTHYLGLLQGTGGQKNIGMRLIRCDI